MLIWYFEDSICDVALMRHGFPEDTVVHLSPPYDGDFWESLPEGTPDVICVDVMLVTVTGFEIIRMIDGVSKLRESKVILASSVHPLASEEWRSAEDRIDLFCEKPITRDKVLRVVEGRGHGT